VSAHPSRRPKCSILKKHGQSGWHTMKNVNALVINPTSTFPSSSMAQINLTLHYPTPTPRYHFLKNTIVLFLFCSNSHKLTASQRKGEDHSGRAKTHLTGIINHGHWESYAFISGEEYYHNSNLNIECLQRVFAHVIRKYNRLPDHLFVQMDNCSRFHLPAICFLFQKILSFPHCFCYWL